MTIEKMYFTMKEKTFGGIPMELNLIPRPQTVTMLEGSVSADLPVQENVDANLPKGRHSAPNTQSK